MLESVRDSARDLVERAAAKGQLGSVVERTALESVARETRGCIPLWYIDLLCEVPLAGLVLGWQAYEPDEEWDGVSWMEWSNAQHMRAECLEAYPGIAILQRGYVSVALDLDGGGDPYFIPTDQGEDPPLYQVFHDLGDHPDTILEHGRHLVAPSLSGFFRTAMIEQA